MNTTQRWWYGALRAAAAAVLLGMGWTPGASADEPGKTPPADKSAAQPAAKSITTAHGPVGDLLRKWYAEGTAAGNHGDFYDNRDRGHSDLSISQYPQLSRVTYTEEDRKIRRDWAAQGAILPLVVFGNSSTSAGVQQGGSNPRMFYSHSRGLLLLYGQYSGNNIYIYPEHLDYDPGHSGSPGYGDLYPTNTPYLIISQGSSGSDQPFMQAVAFTLAAFRPEVKTRLVESGLLMPAIQMIFRISNKQLADPKEYLTGKAHPTVFQGPEVNTLKMVELAHQLTPETLPPMIQLAVREEDEVVAGRDFFEAGGAEKLGDTPAVIARVCRSRSFTRRIVVSAQQSYDPGKRPLAYHWVVLRGDADRIRIKPLGKDGAAAEIVVPWHERRPIAEGSPLESNRVDIGVFVHNGTYYSAPGFVTFFFNDDEARTCDESGRLLEIGYGVGQPEIQVPNWMTLLDLFKPDAGSPGARLLKRAFTKEETAIVLQAAEQYRAARAALEDAREKRKKAEDDQKAAKKAEADPEALKKVEADLAAARKAEDTASKAAEDVLSRKRDGLRSPVKETVVDALRAMVTNPAFYTENTQAIGEALRDDAGKSALAAARKRLVAWGLAKDSPDGPLVLQSIRGAAAPDAARLTRFEKALLAQFHGELLGRILFPGTVNCSYRTNYVDPRISAPKSWRDVYHYDSQGTCTGWTRYDGQQATEFSADGLMVLERDGRGRCVKARTVRYEQEPARSDPGHRRFGPNWNPLRCVPGDEIATYQYAGETDRKGRIVKKEQESVENKPAPASK